jgi:hypothetical protein
MSSAKLPKLPAILLANDLLDGDVVVRTQAGWSRNPAEAAIAADENAALTLEAEGRAAMARNEVVDAYLVEVDIRRDGLAVPRHFRERFRILGPTIRPDLGKQAEFSLAEQHDV